MRKPIPAESLHECRDGGIIHGELDKHGLASPMGLAIELLNAAFVLQQPQHGPGHGTDACDLISVVKELCGGFAAHAEDGMQH